MRHEVKKISKMIDELTTFFLEHEAQGLTLNIEVEGDMEVINVTAKNIPDNEVCVERLNRFLSYPRELEMEEYYWKLAGDGDTSKELGLVGMMIDEANVSYDEETISLKLLRKK